MPASAHRKDVQGLTDRHTLGVDCAQIAVLKQVHDEVLSGLQAACSVAAVISSNSLLPDAHLLHGQEALSCPSERLWRQLVCDLTHLQRRSSSPRTQWHRKLGHFQQQTHQPGKGQLAQEQLCAALKLANFPEGDRSGPEAVRLSLGAWATRCAPTSWLNRPTSIPARACPVHPPALPFLPVPGVPAWAATTLSCVLTVFPFLAACTAPSQGPSSQRRLVA